jgi:membrane protease YdiL (CAAX protease family)
MAPVLVNALCLAQTTAPAGEPAVTPVQKAFAVLVAIGVCVLVVWLLPRLADRRKLSLDLTPGRRNTINPILLLLPPIAFAAVMSLTSAAISFLVPPTATVADPGRAVLEPHVVLPSVLAAQAAAVVTCLFVGRIGFALGVRNGMGLNLRHWRYDALRAAVAYLAALPVIYGLLWVGEQMYFLPRNDHPLLDWARSDIGAGWKSLIVLSAAAGAPLAEELFFRGLVQSAARRYLRRPWAAVGVTAAIFAAVHWGDQPRAVPALFMLGITLGYVYERSGRLLPAILLHAIFNGVNLAVALS